MSMSLRLSPRAAAMRSRSPTPAARLRVGPADLRRHGAPGGGQPQNRERLVGQPASPVQDSSEHGQDGPPEPDLSRLGSDLVNGHGHHGHHRQAPKNEGGGASAPSSIAWPRAAWASTAATAASIHMRSPRLASFR